MVYIGLFCLLISFMLDGKIVGSLDWKDVYLVNNTDYDLEVAADVTNIPNINDVARPKKFVAYHTTWTAPKKTIGKESVIRLDDLNKLNNITVKALIPDESTVPVWLQQVYPISINPRKTGNVLLIYVNIVRNHWVNSQRYVKAVTMESGGASGYSIVVDQI